MPESRKVSVPEGRTERTETIVRTLHEDGTITDSEPGRAPQKDPLRSMALSLIRSGLARTASKVVILERTVVTEATPWREVEQVTPKEAEQ